MVLGLMNVVLNKELYFFKSVERLKEYMETNNDTDEIILFTIGEVICGLDIRQIREIKRSIDITTIYGAPTEVHGVINLRGEIVTVLDIRKRFGYSSLEPDGKERIIIVPFKDELVGILVDFVDDVLSYNSAETLPVPQNMESSTAQFFSEVYPHNNSIVSLINLEELLSFQDEPESVVV